MTQQKWSKPVAPRSVRAECFLLCDYARAENGKLYIVGGGWDELIPERLPLNHPISVAVKLVVPLERVAGSLVVEIDAVDATGQVIGTPWRGSRIAAQPLRGVPGAATDEPQDASLFIASHAVMEILEPGRFTLRLLVDGEVVATTGFAVRPPALPIGSQEAEGNGMRAAGAES